MNPEMPHGPDNDLEARLTALLLGELSAEQAAELEEAISKDPALAELRAHLQQTIGVVQEAVRSTEEKEAHAAEPLKLSSERREKLLNAFKVIPVTRLEEARRWKVPWRECSAIAAMILALLILVGSLFFLKQQRPDDGKRELRVDLMSKGGRSWSGAGDASGDRAVPSRGLAALRANESAPVDSVKPEENKFTGRYAFSSSARAGSDSTWSLFEDSRAAVAGSAKAGEIVGAAGSVNLAGTADFGAVDSGALTMDYSLAPLNRPVQVQSAPAKPSQGTTIVLPAAIADTDGLGTKTEGKDLMLYAGVANLGDATPGAMPAPQRPPAAMPETSAGTPITIEKEQQAATRLSRADYVNGVQITQEAPPVVDPSTGLPATAGSTRGAGGGAGGGGIGGGMGGAIAAGPKAPFGNSGPAEPSAPETRAPRGFGTAQTSPQRAQRSLERDEIAVTNGTFSPDARFRGFFEGEGDRIGRRVDVGGQVAVNKVMNIPPLASTADDLYAWKSFGTSNPSPFTDLNRNGLLAFDGGADQKSILPQSGPPAQQPQSTLHSVNAFGDEAQKKENKEKIVLPQLEQNVELLGRAEAEQKPQAGFGVEVYRSRMNLESLEKKRPLEELAETSQPTATAGAKVVTDGEKADAKASRDKLFKGLQVEYAEGLSESARKPAPAGGAPAAPAARPAAPAAAVGQLDAVKDLAKLPEAKRENDDLRQAADEAVRRSVERPVPQPEIQTRDNAFSTFSLNVSDVSFKLAAAALDKGTMPDPATVRSEEFINAFDYHDPEPRGGAVGFVWERARYPFAHNRDLVRFSLKTAASGRQPGRPLNLVLLLDNSGSMERADRVQIIRECLRVLSAQLRPEDRVSVVAFARTPRLWVDGLPGNQGAELNKRVGGLTPQGGTNLEDALDLAYQTARRHYLSAGVNRVVLLTDGAANLGNVDPKSLKNKVEVQRKQGVALDCFGIGWEGYNDDLLETLSRNGDGRYGFINTPEAAASEFAGQLAGALRVAASDVKVQVQFNPQRVTVHRQIGYAKHQLKKEEFRDNTVDAAEIGAAEAGNALYLIEVNPQGEGDIGVVRVRYKVPGTSMYREYEWAVPFTGMATPLQQSTPTLRLAGAAAAFSEWLVSSPFAAEVTADGVLNLLNGVPATYGADPRPKKLESMLRQAKAITGR